MIIVNHRIGRNCWLIALGKVMYHQGKDHHDVFMLSDGEREWKLRQEMHTLSHRMSYLAREEVTSFTYPIAYASRALSPSE